MFNEDRTEFKGFTRFYDNEIHPYLLAREQERKIRISKVKLYCGSILAAMLVVGLLVYLKTNTINIVFLITLAGCIAASSIGFRLLSTIKAETKNFLMSHICKFLGWQYQVKDFIPPVLSPWCKNRLLPVYDRVAFEDQMSGTAYETPFTFCEAHLERESKDRHGRKTWRTVFRGVLMGIDFHQEFLGKTVVLRDKGLFNSKKFSGMKRVGLVDPKFEKTFEAYGTDQIEARVLLTPTFMQRLVDLETQMDGKKARFGFWNNKLHIAIEAPSQFEAGSMFTPLTDTDRTQNILTEIDAIFNLIDGVLKPLKSRPL